MQLVIVESPTKAQKIKGFLGSDYTVLSSKGHLFDLPKSKLGLDPENDFRPHYEVIKGKNKVIKEIRKAAKKAEVIFLATDLDREGEAIAWHIAAAIEDLDPALEDLPLKHFKRVVFHEITAVAIKEAFIKPRLLNRDLYCAQKARRILDRLVGYKLSPLLWQKIRYGLSAGRVQSVGLRLIVERERERENFQQQKFFRLQARLKKEKEELVAELISYRGKNYQIKEKLKLFAGDYVLTRTILTSVSQLNKIKKELAAQEWRVKEFQTRESKQRPSPPFTTATLQQNAARELNLSPRQTMKLAQSLYEEGFITYHRTDSTFMSRQFLDKALSFLEKNIGTQYVSPSARVYQNKSKTAQEAHEAIRPTKVEKIEKIEPRIEKKLGGQAARLYALIWRRALSSQLRDALWQHYSLLITAGDYLFKSQVSELKFAGWKILYSNSPEEESKNKNKSSWLSWVEGTKLNLIELLTSEHETSPPPRYTEASLIKDLEKHEIGRPSTYATIIGTLFDRGYVAKEGRSLYPRDTGLVVNDLLVKHFPQIVDLSFTAQMEADLDLVAQGKREWIPLLRDFYQPFIQQLEKKMSEIKKEEVVVLEKTTKKCPRCGNQLVIKLGRYGRFLSCSNFPQCDYAEVLVNESGGEEEMAVDQEQLKEPCPQCGAAVKLKIGRYGPFIACSNYPQCKYTRNYVNKIGLSCPQCQKGEIVVKRTRKGRVFYGCSRYSECQFASWSDPRIKKS